MLPGEGTVIAFCGRILALGRCEFANVLVRMPGGSPGSTPGMAADKCIAAVEKHNEYQNKIEF